MPTPLAPSLRDTLTAATAVEHASLERTSVLRALSSATMTPAAYVAYLARQWQLHKVMEPPLRQWLDAGWTDARLVKAQRLCQDLATQRCHAPARDITWDAPRSAAQAIGTRYVLEGATLGIRQSVQGLPTGHPARGPANRFVHGYGELTGARCKDLLAKLSPVDPRVWLKIVSGAAAASRAFETHFSDDSHAEFDAYVPA